MDKSSRNDGTSSTLSNRKLKISQRLVLGKEEKQRKWNQKWKHEDDHGPYGNDQMLLGKKQNKWMFKVEEGKLTSMPTQAMRA
jgi:hypothetical protein